MNIDLTGTNDLNLIYTLPQTIQNNAVLEARSLYLQSFTIIAGISHETDYIAHFIHKVHRTKLRVTAALRGYCTSYQKLACFVFYLKIINNFMKTKLCILEKNIQGTQKWL